MPPKPKTRLQKLAESIAQQKTKTAGKVTVNDLTKPDPDRDTPEMIERRIKALEKAKQLLDR